MNTKYELLKDDTKNHFGKTLYRIRALVAIGALVSPGDLGGYIESEWFTIAGRGNVYSCNVTEDVWSKDD